MMYYSKIESVGAYYPSQVVSSEKITQKLNLSHKPNLELLTGIRNRRFCNKNEDSLSLALKSIDKCLAYSKYDAEDIEMIINCSISKYAKGLIHYFEPSISLMIKEELGNSKAIHFDISNACAGMITGAAIADSFIQQGIVKNCLVVSGECISSLTKNAINRIDSLWHPEFASLTVGDAGAAVILDQSESEEEKVLSIELKTLSQFSHLCLGYQCTESPGAYMETDMKNIHYSAINNSKIIIEKALKKADLSIGEIDFLIPHQTSKRSILAGKQYVMQNFGELPKNIVENVKDYGNTASTTHFTALYKILKNGSIKSKSTVLLLSYASGIVIGVIIFKINDLRKRYGNDN